ncbi:MAG TPA: DUF937 domain-containing protein [Terrimesophilobacter sp.]|nr:DUF937 domain-containing protein [Terrimesophilobacter sp.]HRP99257.1 DUF937 domain-containing protein [Terrimesophilobacter sp.]
MFEELLKQIPVGDIAKQLGVDKSDAKGAIEQILPSLIGGMAVNAQDEKGAKSLAKALGQHEGKHDSLDDIDIEDGARIVKHVFGDKENDVVAAAALNAKGGGGDLISKILPIVAPIALAWLASKFFGGKDEPAKKEAQETGGGLGDMLGGLVGGLLGGGSGSSSGGGDMLGDLLGGFLGGKK